MPLRISYAIPLLMFALLPALQNAPATPKDAPTYTSDGNLVAPTHYREWIYLTSGIDMSYAASTAPPDHSMFDNVFVNPTSYRSFVANGTWPDKTMLVLEVRGAENPISINKRGHTQSAELMGIEIHVKDHGEWKFYDLSDGGNVAKLIKRPASCYTCHEAHGAVDTTFVQFYPTLLPLATSKHTLSSGYLHDAQQSTSTPAPPRTP
ncbi:MAG: cytochrome P460 family protein [Acidobacteriaceae bacterium]